MIICRNCGTANVSGQVCVKCNANLGTVVTETAKKLTCGNCSSENVAGANFCFNCGQPMKKEAVVFCNSCGASNRVEDDYCLDCGAGLKTPPIAEIKKPQESRPSVPPPSIPPPQNPPQTKTQYRIQLFLMFAALGGMLYLLTQTFFKIETLEISGLVSTLSLPTKIFPEQVGDMMGKIIPPEGEALTTVYAPLAYLLLGWEGGGFAAVFAYGLMGVIFLTVLVIVLFTIVCLFRLIFNKPYNNTRRIFFNLFMLNLVFGGLALASVHVEFVTNLFTGEGLPLLFEPDTFFYAYVGGLLALFIMTRIARVKVPRVTKRQRKKQQRKAEKRAAKRAARLAS